MPAHSPEPEKRLFPAIVSATVAFELGEKELGFWNREGRFVVEPGDFKVAVWNGFSPGALARNAVTYKVGK